MRSVVVVLPASMWAMMPMFLQRSNGTVLGTAFYSFRAPILPPVMREGLIGLGHAMYIFFLLDGGAFSVGGVQQFVAQLVDHASFRAPARIRQQPADRERCAPVGIHFHGHLIVRAADAPC